MPLRSCRCLLFHVTARPNHEMCTGMTKRRVSYRPCVRARGAQVGDLLYGVLEHRGARLAALCWWRALDAADARTEAFAARACDAFTAVPPDRSSGTFAFGACGVWARGGGGSDAGAFALVVSAALRCDVWLCAHAGIAGAVTAAGAHVLVDIGGIFARGGSAETVAARPAHVSVSSRGVLASSGTRYMDYLVAGARTLHARTHAHTHTHTRAHTHTSCARACTHGSRAHCARARAQTAWFCPSRARRGGGSRSGCCCSRRRCCRPRTARRTGRAPTAARAR